MENSAKATERRTYNEILSTLSQRRAHAEVVLSRINQFVRLEPGARILDVGAAAGEFVLACRQLGYDCQGIEPWEEARINAANLAQQFCIPFAISDGTAESIPFGDQTFDLVHAQTVLEHVADLPQALAEIHRVLKPGGGFWFYTASSMCPFQKEIRGFPLFGWYPDRIKRAVMAWATVHKPHLVGNTSHPALNWFTPWKARRLLRDHGFDRVFDRWDLRRDGEIEGVQGAILRVIRRHQILKLLGDMLVQDCAYLALKE